MSLSAGVSSVSGRCGVGACVSGCVCEAAIYMYPACLFGNEKRGSIGSNACTSHEYISVG